MDTLYKLYKSCRQQLCIRHDCTVSFNNDILQVTVLVMMLEDMDAALEARFEAERCPQSVKTKRCKYDRAEVARTAHKHAKAISIGSYHQRLSQGFKMAWYAAKRVVSVGYKTQVVCVKPIKSVTTIAASAGTKTWKQRLWQNVTSQQHSITYF